MGARSICILKPFASLQKISWMWGVKHETFGNPFLSPFPNFPSPRKREPSTCPLVHLSICFDQYAPHLSGRVPEYPNSMSLGWKIRCENSAKDGGKEGMYSSWLPPLLTDGPPIASLFLIGGIPLFAAGLPVTVAVEVRLCRLPINWIRCTFRDALPAHAASGKWNNVSPNSTGDWTFGLLCFFPQNSRVFKWHWVIVKAWLYLGAPWIKVFCAGCSGCYVFTAPKF